MRALHVQIDDDLYERLKIRAVKERKSLKELLLEAISLLEEARVEK